MSCIFRIIPFISLVSCNHCNLVGFLLLTILSMAYTPSIDNNRHSLWLKFLIFSAIVSQTLLISTSMSKFSKAARFHPEMIFTFYLVQFLETDPLHMKSMHCSLTVTLSLTSVTISWRSVPQSAQLNN
jgi:hypothetical protein